MAPRIVKLLKGNKRKHNDGPNPMPFTKKEVERAGSTEEAYRRRAARGSERAMDVVERIEEVTGEKRKLTRL